MPIGKAFTFEADGEARASFIINTDIKLARDWYCALKFAPELQQFSFGFRVLDQSRGEHDGRSIRFLKQLELCELSPVLVAAGVNTRVVCLGADCESAALGRRVEKTLVRCQTRSLVDSFHDLTSGGYKEELLPSDTEFTLIHVLTSLALDELDIKQRPSVRFFRDLNPGEKADLPWRRRIQGLCEEGTIWIKLGRTGSDLIQTVAHECFHLTQPTKTHDNGDQLEAEADAFGRYFAKKFGTLPDDLYAHAGFFDFDPYNDYRDAPRRSVLIDVKSDFIWTKDNDFSPWRKFRRWRYGA